MGDILYYFLFQDIKYSQGKDKQYGSSRFKQQGQGKKYADQQRIFQVSVVIEFQIQKEKQDDTHADKSGIYIYKYRPLNGKRVHGIGGGREQRQGLAVFRFTE
jgi:hypothetical protein